jgi:putative redox protein
VSGFRRTYHAPPPTREYRYNLPVPSKPPIVADLTWTGDLTFSATVDNASLTIDSSGVAGPSPVEALGGALAGCMSVDIAHILTRGRHPFRVLRSHLVADRAQEEPHRFVRVALHFTVEGDVPADAIERAIALSREKYCSVWHSLRQDIDFTVTFEQHV